MTRWNTGSSKSVNRGEETEILVDYMNDQYKIRKVAVFDKIPTPIKVLRMAYGKITEGYYEKKSTVDYHGVYKGKAICFDAKETERPSLPLSNIHQHQVDYMNDFEYHGGLAFILAYFKKTQNYYLIPLSMINEYWEDMNKGGRKSIPEKDIPEELKIPDAYGLPDYLKIVDQYYLSEENTST